MTDVEYLRKYLEADRLEEGLELLEKGVPVQYIVGNVDFYGNVIKVNSSVLIPRFETELLVSKTIDYVKKYFDYPVKVVDLGTGSGAIAITLKKKLDCTVDAVDISSLALDVAKANAIDNNVSIDFFLGDMLDGVDGKYDVIISNPPYVAYDEEIEDIVRNNEPSIALFADDDGLEFYEKILSKASSKINSRSLIAFEIGRNQGLDIKKIAYKYFPSCEVKIEQDLALFDRFVFIFINL